LKIIACIKEKKMATLLKKRFLAQFVQESLMNVENTIKEEKSDVLLIDIENNISDDERNNKKLNEKISNNDTPLIVYVENLTMRENL